MTTVFGNPGSTELAMFVDFPEDFRYVLGLQESVVVGMADGYAQAKRTAAFVNLHSAVGVGHAMGAIFTAYRNRTPLLITAGQQSRGILPFDPFLSSVRATELPQPYVKWAVEPARAADVWATPCRPWFTTTPVTRCWLLARSTRRLSVFSIKPSCWQTWSTHHRKRPRVCGPSGSFTNENVRSSA